MIPVVLFQHEMADLGVVSPHALRVRVSCRQLSLGIGTKV